MTPEMTLHIDESVYPDLDEPPRELRDDAAKADYVHPIAAMAQWCKTANAEMGAPGSD